MNVQKVYAAATEDEVYSFWSTQEKAETERTRMLEAGAYREQLLIVEVLIDRSPEDGEPIFG